MTTFDLVVGALAGVVFGVLGILIIDEIGAVLGGVVALCGAACTLACLGVAAARSARAGRAGP